MPNDTKPPTSPLPLDAYYDSTHRGYLVADEDGNWMPIDTASLKIRLRKLSFRTNKQEGENISPVDMLITRIQDERNVQYVGCLAGFTRGIHYINGAKILVTHSPKCVEPKQGDWSLIRQVIEGQLLDDHRQADRFHGWVQNSESSLRACMRTGIPTYGQALILAGPKSCGKSLLQALLTHVFGGRSAGPYRYMSGITAFNRELFGSEHQKIEDEQPFKDQKSRVRFGDAIKNVASTTEGSCHGKNREAIKLTPFWRLTLSVNDEPEHLEILPPFNDSLMDKIILLHCKHAPMPMPAGTNEEKTVFWNALVAQLPAYVWWLQNEFVIAPEMRNARYGTAPFFHPYIVGLLDDISPKVRLLSVCQHVLFMDGLLEWEGTGEELQRVLSESTYKQAARSIIPSDGPGKLLAQLAVMPNPLVFDTRTAVKRTWKIVAAKNADPTSDDAMTPVPEVYPKMEPLL